MSEERDVILTLCQKREM